MDLIIFADGMYQLVPVTQDLIGSISLVDAFDFFDLCEVLRLQLTIQFNINQPNTNNIIQPRIVFINSIQNAVHL